MKNKRSKYDIKKEYFMVDYLNQLQPGDIILESGTKPHSKLIATATDGPYSHAYIALSNTVLVHATKEGGVFSCNPQRVLVDSFESLVLFRLKDISLLTPQNVLYLEKFLRQEIGCLYSVPEAIKVVTNPTNCDYNFQFCSRLVAQAYEAIGIELVKNTNFANPNELAKSSLLKQVDKGIIEASEESVNFANTLDKVKINQEETYKWLKKARKFVMDSCGEVIRSQTDVSEIVRVSPHFGKIIASYIRETDYCTMYLEEKKANPWRYDVNICYNALVQQEIVWKQVVATIEELRKVTLRLGQEYDTCSNIFQYIGDEYHKLLSEMYYNIVKFHSDGIEAMKKALNQFAYVNSEQELKDTLKIINANF